MRKIPNFFIVGKPKSGTTAMHSLLGRHPEIFMSPEKEPHHFHMEYLQAGIERNRGYKGLPYKSRRKYLKLFDGSVGEKVLGESSTGYLYSKSAAKEIANFNSNAKILMCFREPVDFIHSFHNELLRSANESEQSFRDAIALERQRKQGMKIPSTTTFPDNLFYSEQVKYCDQASRYFNEFPSTQIKAIFFDDFQADSTKVIQDILRFLEVDSDFSPDIADIHPTKTARTPRIAMWLAYFGEKSPYAVSRWMPEKLLQPMRYVLRKVLMQEGPLRAIDPAFRRELMLQFKPEVVRLGDLLQVDLCQKWGYED